MSKRLPATYVQESPAANRPRRRRMRLAGMLALALTAWLAVAALTGDGSAEAQTSALSVADFDQGGLQVVALASFTAGGATTLYSSADSRWGATGSLLEGDVGLSADSKIVRVMVPARDGSLLRLNDDGPLVLRAWFGESGAGADLTVWLQTDAGTTSFAANDFKTVGNSYVNFNVPATGRAIVTGIGAGDRFVLALTRPAPTPVPTLDARATPTPVPNADARANANADARANAACDRTCRRIDADVPNADARANVRPSPCQRRRQRQRQRQRRRPTPVPTRRRQRPCQRRRPCQRQRANADARDDEQWGKRPEPVGAGSG